MKHVFKKTPKLNKQTLVASPSANPRPCLPLIQCPKCRRCRGWSPEQSAPPSASCAMRWPRSRRGSNRYGKLQKVPLKTQNEVNEDHCNVISQHYVLAVSDLRRLAEFFFKSTKPLGVAWTIGCSLMDSNSLLILSPFRCRITTFVPRMVRAPAAFLAVLLGYKVYKGRAATATNQVLLIV